MIYLQILHIQNNYDKIYTQKINNAPNFEIFKRERNDANE